MMMSSDSMSAQYGDFVSATNRDSISYLTDGWQSGRMRSAQSQIDSTDTFRQGQQLLAIIISTL